MWTLRSTSPLCLTDVAYSTALQYSRLLNACMGSGFDVHGLSDLDRVSWTILSFWSPVLIVRPGTLLGRFRNCCAGSDRREPLGLRLTRRSGHAPASIEDYARASYRAGGSDRNASQAIVRGYTDSSSTYVTHLRSAASRSLLTLAQSLADPRLLPPGEDAEINKHSSTYRSYFSAYAEHLRAMADFGKLPPPAMGSLFYSSIAVCSFAAALSGQAPAYSDADIELFSSFPAMSTERILQTITSIE